LIISHKYKFIFVKTPKTAGTSMEIALARICDSKDVVTRYEHIVFDGHVPRNYGDFEQHSSARQIKKAVTPEIWNNYFKFAFERNPFEKMVSMYWFRIGEGGFKGSFKDFCIYCKDNPKKFPKGFQIYGIDNQIAVDFVGRYETLSKDFQHICKKLNLPCEGDLPKIRDQYQKVRKHYSEYYDDECKRIVEEHFSKEISYFKYVFEEK